MSIRTALSRLVTRWLTGARSAAPRPGPPAPAEIGEPADPIDDDRPRGCGWFDSSFELRRGLAVVEHGAAELALAVEWLFAAEAQGHEASASRCPAP